MDGLSMPVLPLLGNEMPQMATRRGLDARAQPSIDEVATNFESMMLSQLLKEMRQTLEPDGLFPQDNGDILGGLFDLYLGQHLAQGRGMGLAEALKRQLGTYADHQNSKSSQPTIRATA